MEPECGDPLEARRSGSSQSHSGREPDERPPASEVGIDEILLDARAVLGLWKGKDADAVGSRPDAVPIGDR